ncbi:HNH endonuclease [Rhizobium leguminosarum]|uniref:HNH endonuclease n=1 Tax=Rhizobium TaxID=379 RepID=UPI00140F65D3|nr:HNH endonuclease signature motif containing protein [Rhizobium leguminosarum]QIO64841.1 HNH endonuclease [Rhizobium leguminosarum bv. trifolii]
MAVNPENGRDWTDAELFACVVAYRDLQMEEQAGVRVNKTEKRNSVLRGALSSRSAGAYEFRMANISAVLEELGLPTLNGYLSRGNVGAKVVAKIVPMINLVWQRQNMPELPTADREDLETRVLSARQKFKGNLATPPPIGFLSATRIQSTTARFIRDPNVIAWVLVMAAGVCEVCEEPAPFVRDDGEPYLEVHHVRPLAEGGPDSADNAIAVCPTCHRRFHHGSDKDTFRGGALRKISRLKNHPKVDIRP